MGSKNVHWAVTLTSESRGPAKEEPGGNAAWGVFKAYAVFFFNFKLVNMGEGG